MKLPLAIFVAVACCVPTAEARCGFRWRLVHALAACPAAPTRSGHRDCADGPCPAAEAPTSCPPVEAAVQAARATAAAAVAPLRGGPPGDCPRCRRLPTPLPPVVLP